MASNKLLHLNAFSFNFYKKRLRFYLFFSSYFSYADLCVCVCNGYADESDDMIRVDSDKFQSIIDEVESLHNLGILPIISYLFFFFFFFFFNYILPNCLANKL
jgi:hypothetical protein